MPLPSLSMMMCVHNEAEHIVDHLIYHHALGVRRAYVFLDHCTDATRELLGRFTWVQAIEANRARDLAQLTIYQNQCASKAIRLAREDGFRWLLHIDVDEYAWGANSNTGVAGGSLTQMISKADSATETIWLQTKEAVPVQGECSGQIWSPIYFQQLPNVLTRQVLNPVSNRMESLNKWLGHKMGKSIVRTDIDAVPLSAHRWQRANDPLGKSSLIEEVRGFHYHFVASSPRHWQQKYQKLAWEAPTWENGAPVPFPKQAWKEASLIFEESEANEYFERWVAIPKTQAESLVEDTKLTCERNVSSIFSEI